MFDDHDDKGNTGGVLGIGAVKILALPKGGGGQDFDNVYS